MQWLIDIAIEAMEQYLVDNPRFVDRGDPAAIDWDQTDLTMDGAWHDLDCSAIVPAGAQAILFGLEGRHNFIHKRFELRKKGNVNTINKNGFITQVANVWYRCDIVCACDSDRKIQYMLTPGAWLAAYIVVKGWWL